MLADEHGNVVHLGERDCSIQRRHQKLIEESPAPLVDDELRERIGEIAVEAARAVDYRGAGTIEGLLQDGEYFFLEMNTRVQVEHCVTEAVTGVDIVREQILIAAGEQLSLRPGRHPLARARDRVPHQRRGRGEELRARARARSPHYREPSGPGRARRLRRAGRLGDHAAVRPDGRQADRLGRRPREGDAADGARAATSSRSRACATLIPFHKAIMASEQWANGETCRDLIEDKAVAQDARAARSREKAEDEAETVARDYVVEVSGKRFEVKVHGEARRRPTAAAPAAAARAAARAQDAAAAAAAATRSTSPLQGNVFKVLVEQGADVEEGALVCIIEAMKMENEITAHKAGKIAELPISEGAAVTAATRWR